MNLETEKHKRWISDYLFLVIGRIWSQLESIATENFKSIRSIDVFAKIGRIYRSIILRWRF